MRRLLALLSLLLIGACAGVPGGADPAARLAGLPAQLAGLPKQQVRVYPLPGLGASVSYSVPGTTATVYLYDRGQADVASAPRQNAEAELNIALQEIVQASRSGVYRLDGVAAPYALPGPDRGLTIQCAPFRLTFPNGQQGDSVACVGFSRLHYLKLRFTGPVGSQGLLGRFVAELNPLL